MPTIISASLTSKNVYALVSAPRMLGNHYGVQMFHVYYFLSMTQKPALMCWKTSRVVIMKLHRWALRCPEQPKTYHSPCSFTRLAPAAHRSQRKIRAADWNSNSTSNCHKANDCLWNIFSPDSIAHLARKPTLQFQAPPSYRHVAQNHCASKCVSIYCRIFSSTG